MYNDLFEHARSFGQEHLFAFWKELPAHGRNSLAMEVQSLDFPLLKQLYENRDSSGGFIEGTERATDPPAYRLRGEADSGGGTLTADLPITPEEAVGIGKNALAQGKLAVVLVAGGQGTRLGFSDPKGMYPIGPLSDTTLFQIHAEKTLALSRKYGKPVPLCVMTSPATNDATIAFFEKHARFGIPESDFFVFRQGTMPAVDAKTGKVLLSSKNAIALSPNGHGGMLAAIATPRKECGNRSILDLLDSRGVENMFYFQVDNPLVDVCSEEMIGYHLGSGSELSSQVIRKRFPEDRVGNVVRIDGRLCIIEYSDISDELANRRNPDGSLAIWAGSIAVHLMNLAFLKRMAAKADSLPYHIARKKVAYIATENNGDDAADFGKERKPAEPNAIKFERFIFDLIPSANKSIVIEVDIPHNYAPLKNAPGSPDSPETVRAQLSAFHAERLKKAGAIFPDGVTIEISPLFAGDLDGIKAKIPPGTVLQPNVPGGICLAVETVP